MWSSQLLIVGCIALLFSGVSSVPKEKNVGESLDLSLPTIGENVIGCYLNTPTGLEIEFRPENKADENKYELRQINLVSGCAVIVKNLEESDNGAWTLRYTNDQGTGNKQTINLTVHSLDDENEEKDNTDDTITRLNKIIHRVRTELSVDISLSRKSYEEECFLTHNAGDPMKLEEILLEGVTMQNKSQFVSCRVTIAPINEKLLGDWELCGKHKENSIEYTRCQPVNIIWSNSANPDRHWTNRTQPLYNHAVHFGFTLTPVVRGSGDVKTCHIVTPLGEDLVVTPQSDYPSIVTISSQDNWDCSIAIGPIDSSLLGYWVIYGTYLSIFSGFQEERLPMNLYLYNEDNPYEQAYNITTVPSNNYIVNLGNTIEVEVAAVTSHSITNTDDCLFETPTSEKHNMHEFKSSSEVSFIDVGSRRACRISIGPITEEMLGTWLLIGKFNSRGIYAEHRLTFDIIKEDPANPIEDDRRTIENLNEQYFDTNIGASHRIALTINSFVTVETCHIRTPDGLQYTIMEGFNISGVEVIDNVACGVVITVSEELIGKWTLISRETRYSNTLFERRQPFTIYVEEYVTALPQEVTVAEGNDLYVRLEQSTTLHDSCKLVGPNNETPTYEIDDRFYDSCGFIVRNIETYDSGPWEIIYGKKIIYRAVIKVNVNERAENKDWFLVWIKDRPIQIITGPEDAVYCKVMDPNDVVIFEGFGRCNISLNRVVDQHGGFWKSNVGLPGRVLTENHNFHVNVVHADSKPTVITYVNKNQEEKSVYLSCSVSSQFPIRSCSFREPSGRVFLASQGVGEDRYSFHSNGVSVESDVHEHDCGLRITSPVVEDLGIWRCTIHTESETYYGFLTVMWSDALKDKETPASLLTEPTLKADQENLYIVEGDSVLLTCSVDASIRYCYFRSENGTIYNVRPGIESGSMEYAGAGLDAGECGVRLSSLNVIDSGIWSCHVGFNNVSEPEQTDWITVYVKKRLSVYQNMVERNAMQIQSQVVDNREIEYCRFVRSDGLGFTKDNMHDTNDKYRIEQNLIHGRCGLYIQDPCDWDLYPWAVIVKIKGQDTEVSGVTQQVLLTQTQRTYFTYLLIWLPVTVLVLSIIAVSVMLGPKKHREWTYSRASSIRYSVRNGFRKTPITERTGQNEKQNNVQCNKSNLKV